MPESTSTMQCLSASVVLAIKKIYGIEVPEEFLLVGPGFLNIQLDKEHLTFDSTVNDIVLNYIGHDTTVESLSNISPDKSPFPLVINLPVRYLKYASVYTTSENLNYHHFILLTAMEREKLSVFDSYVPSNPIKSMSGEIHLDKNNMNDIRVLKVNFRKLLQWIVTNRSIDTVFSEVMSTKKVFAPWTDLKNLVKSLSVKDARKMAYNLADSNVPGTRLAMVNVICKKRKEDNLFSNLAIWQQQWLILRVCLYKYSITKSSLDLKNAQDVIEKLRGQDEYLLKNIGSVYYDSNERNN